MCRSLLALALPLLVLSTSCSSGGEGDDLPALPARATVLRGSGASGELRLRLVDHDTGEEFLLDTEVPTGFSVYLVDAAFTPDLSHVAFAIRSPEEDRGVVVDTRTGVMRTVLTHTFASTLPGRATSGQPPIFDYADDGSRLLVTWYDESDDFRASRVCAADGTDVRPLANGEVPFARWVPGTTIVAVGEPDPVSGPDTMGLYDGTTGALLQGVPAVGPSDQIFGLTVSEDGSKVAFGVVQFNFAAMRGTSLDDPVVLVLDVATGSSVVLDPILGEIDEAYIRLSDDGSRVAFVALDTANGAPDRVFVGDVGTGALTDVTPSGAVANSVVRRLEWEPGGADLLVVADHREENTPEVFVSVAGAVLEPARTMIPSDVSVQLARWSPAGGELSFIEQGNVSSDRRLYLYAPGSAFGPVPVDASGGTSAYYDFIWTPDGEWIVAHESALDGWHARSFKADGSATHDLGNASAASWAAEGSFGPFRRVDVTARPDGRFEVTWITDDDPSGFAALAACAVDEPTSRQTVWVSGANHSGALEAFDTF